MKIIAQENIPINFDLSYSKFLIKKDLGFRVILEDSQNKSNPEFWDYETLEKAQKKYDSIELNKFS